jgi:hypothetical protein
MKSFLLITLLIGLSLCGNISAKGKSPNKATTYIQYHKTPTSNQVQMQTVIQEQNDSNKNIIYMNQRRYVRSSGLNKLYNNKGMVNNMKYKKVFWKGKKGNFNNNNNNKDLRIIKYIRKQKLSNKM